MIDYDKLDAMFQTWWNSRRLGWHSQFDCKEDAARDGWINGYLTAKNEQEELKLSNVSTV